MFWKCNPDLQYVRPFGCLAYALIPKEKRTRKFQFNSTPCIFLGMSPNHSAYRLLSLHTNSEIISRDVTFYENVYPFKDENIKLNEFASDVSTTDPEMPIQIEQTQHLIRLIKESELADTSTTRSEQKQSSSVDAADHNTDIVMDETNAISTERSNVAMDIE